MSLGVCQTIMHAPRGWLLVSCHALFSSKVGGAFVSNPMPSVMIALSNVTRDRRGQMRFLNAKPCGKVMESGVEQEGLWTDSQATLDMQGHSFMQEIPSFKDPCTNPPTHTNYWGLNFRFHYINEDILEMIQTHI